MPALGRVVKARSEDGELEFWLPYGRTDVPIAVPDENLLGFLSPVKDFLSQNLDQVIANASQYRIGEHNLLEAVKNTKKTVIAFNAESAASAMLVNRLASELSETGAEGVCLLESAPDPTQPRSSPVVPEKNPEGAYPLLTHDPRSSPAVKVGEIEGRGEVLINEAFAGADIRCTVTNVAVNPFWGYSGGPSFVLLGLASEKTIKTCLGPTLRSARLPTALSGNPMYEALLQASQLVRVDFAVHFVERPEGTVGGAFVGDFLGTFQQACALAGMIFRPTLQRKADIVISSAGGAPWDHTLFDASRAAMIAATACKDQGIIVLVAECADGLGRFPSTRLTVPQPRGQTARGRTGFTLERLVEQSLRRLCAEHRLYLVSTLPEHQASLYGLLAARSVGTALQRAIRHAGKDAKVALIPYGCVTAPSVG